jgi:S1-C subfamily serine protease
MLSTADVSAGSLITHIDGEELTSLQDAERVLSERAQGARLRVRYQTVEDPFHSYETLALMDRRWYPMRRCVRDDSSGRWPCTDAAAPPAPEETVPASVILPPTSEKIQRAFAGALVMVDFDIPYPTAGVKDLNYIGAGTVIDAERGLILVDRDTVPVTLGDITLTFAGAVRVPGRMVYLHPIHNFAVLGYDPALLGDTPVNAVTFSDKPVRSGDRVWQVGLDADHAVVSMATRVSSIEPVELGVSRTPRYRDANIDVMVLDDAAGSLGGVVVDKRGRVLGLWASFLDQQSSERAFYGLPNTFLRPVVGPLTRGEIPSYSWIGAELAPISLATARDRGLSDDRVRAVIKHDPQGRRVFEVRRVQAQTDAALSLRDTDLVLALDGMPLTRMRELEWFYGRSQVTLTILRDGKEQEVTLGTVPVQGAGVHQVVSWAGLLIHEPHFEVEQQQGIPAPGVYIAWLWYGSPGARYGIRPTRRIIQVNGKATPDMGAFLEAVQGQADREPVRLLMEGLDGSTRVGTLKLDLQYWPTQIFAFENGEWSRSTTPGMTAQND